MNYFPVLFLLVDTVSVSALTFDGCPLICKHGSLPDTNSSDCVICNIDCPPGYTGTLCDTWAGNSSDIDHIMEIMETTAAQQKAAINDATSDPSKDFMCRPGQECVGWGMDSYTGKPTELLWMNLKYSNPANQYKGILLPDGIQWTPVPKVGPVYDPPNGAYAFQDITQFLAHKDNLRSQNIVQRGNRSYTLSNEEAFEQLFNSKSDDRAPTIAQVSMVSMIMDAGSTTSELDTRVTDMINILPPTYADAPDLWDTFFSYWGTHAIVKCNLGGLLEQQSFWKTHILQTGDHAVNDLSEEAKLEFAVNTGLVWPGASGTPQSWYTEVTTHEMSCFGGDPTLCPIATPNSTRDWIHSIPTRPKLIQYNGQLLSRFISDVELQNSFDQGVTDYLEAKQKSWDSKNKCPKSCSFAGATGTCDSTTTDQYACDCPCKLGRMCQGPAVCFDSTCCKAQSTTKGCDYHFERAENIQREEVKGDKPKAQHQDAENGDNPNGDGWWKCATTGDIPAKGSCEAYCDAHIWGMHCNCAAQAPLVSQTTVVSSSPSGDDPQHMSASGAWGVHMGCGGTCSRDTKISYEASWPNDGTKCTYPTICKSAAAQHPGTRTEYDHRITQLQTEGQFKASYELAEDGVKQGIYGSMWQRPSTAFIPGVESKPFPDVDNDWPFVAELHRSGMLETIQDEVRAFDTLYTSSESPSSEFHNVISSGHPTLPTLPTGKSNDFWGQVLLMDRQLNLTADAIKYFPKTTDALRRVLRTHAQDVQGMPPGGVTIARIPPGVTIKAHCGVTNARLRVSYGVKIPRPSTVGGQPACAIRVANETKVWVEGKALVLDDSFEHEAWNLSEEDRVVLLADFWHPQLSEDQRQKLINGAYTHERNPSPMLFGGSTFERLHCT